MTDLYILVGTNPLPCYISALYLKSYFGEIGSLYLVCSEENTRICQSGSYDIGKRIKKALVEAEHIDETLIKCIAIEDVGSSVCIENALRDCVKPDSGVHLNYTGGTKSMSVHAIRYLGRENDFSSSYLDAHRNVMIMDGDIANGCSGDLRENDIYALDLDLIAKLHGLDDLREKGLDESCTAMLPKLEEYLRGNLIDSFYDPEEGFCRNLDIVCLAKRPIVKEVLDQYKTEDFSAMKKSESEKIKNYLGGIWFEEHIYRSLQQSSHPFKIYFDVVKGKDSEFQIDLLCVYGYQTTVISVTTDDKKGMNKLKAFEAIYRAQQIGGGESKFILICLMEDVRALGGDLHRDLGSVFSRFKVFGLTDVLSPDFCNQFTEYVKE